MEDQKTDVNGFVNFELLDDKVVHYHTPDKQEPRRHTSMHEEPC